jgi:hypothetical protein
MPKIFSPGRIWGVLLIEWEARVVLYQIRLGKYIIVKARRSAGGRRQEENNYSIKTGFCLKYVPISPFSSSNQSKVDPSCPETTSRGQL